MGAFDITTEGGFTLPLLLKRTAKKVLKDGIWQEPYRQRASLLNRIKTALFNIFQNRK